MRINLLSIIIIFFLQKSEAQHLPQYSLYMLNPAQLNPAYAGMEGTLSINGIFRKQWVNLTGSPSQQNVTAHLPLFFVSSGAGIMIDNDISGARRLTSGTLQYNYQLEIGKTGILSLGAGLGIAQLTLDGSKLRTPDGSYVDNIIDHKDDLLTTGLQQAASLSMHTGIYFQTEKMGVGVGVLNLNKSKFQLEKGRLELSNAYTFFGRYNIDLGKYLLMQPSVMVKSDLNETQIDFSTVFTYNGNIFGGVSYRGYSNNSIDGMVALAGFKLNRQTMLSYAYDFSLSSLSNSNSGSHEILLNFRLDNPVGKGKLPKIIYNPRFL